MRQQIKRLPLIGPVLTRLYRRLMQVARPFRSSKDYWEARYAHGGHSGAGSYGELARFKADVLNRFVETEAISRVIELGCGDGHQLSLAHYPNYQGFDVSEMALTLCRARFADDPRKSFHLMNELEGKHATLTLSLDVIYHLVEDTVFETYLEQLFAASERFVIIYSSDTDENPPDQIAHVRHRAFTPWIKTHLSAWHLRERIVNAHPFEGDLDTGSCADFFIYERRP